MQFSPGQMESHFHRPQGDLPFRGDFALTHPFEKSEIDHLSLCFGQFLNHAVKKFASSLFQVGKYEGKLALSCPATQ